MPTLEDQCSVVHDHPCLRARCLRWCWRRRKRWRTAARWSSACRCDTPSCAPSSQDQRPAPAARGTGVAAPAEVASCGRPPWLGAKCCALQWSAHIAPRPAAQSTGEAAVDAMQLNAGDQCGWVSTTRELLRRFVAAHFPTHREVPGSGAKGARRAPARPADGLTQPARTGSRRPGSACPSAAAGRAGRFSAAL